MAFLIQVLFIVLLTFCLSAGIVYTVCEKMAVTGRTSSHMHGMIVFSQLRAKEEHACLTQSCICSTGSKGRCQKTLPSCFILTQKLFQESVFHGGLDWLSHCNIVGCHQQALLLEAFQLEYHFTGPHVLLKQNCHRICPDPFEKTDLMKPVGEEKKRDLYLLHHEINP